MDKIPLQNNNETGVVETNSVALIQHNQKDNKVQYLSERAKKLVTAVYLVTNLIPPTDPLRQSIREFSIKILSFMGRTPVGHSLSDVNLEVENLIQKVVELLEVAFFSGYVSEMNFTVLKTEFDLFTEEMSEYESSQGSLSSDSLKAQSGASLAPVDNSGTRIRTGIQKGSLPAKSGQPVSGGRESYGPPKRNIVEAKKNSRREAILTIIKRRGEVNIKDISTVVINCSEKTIQRELLELVASGIIKKAGERRWSTYSLS